jgi:predicted naringenin-chalcone synthase
MYAPGLDIDLVHVLGLKAGVERTCINFMGCYAAFNAVKIADSFCKAYDGSKVLIVCTEMCSIHFQKQTTADNLLANALFADGAAALLMESSPRNGTNLSPEVFHNTLVPSNDHHMAWSIGNLGFEMKLSSYVPEIIQGGIRKLSQSLLEKINRNLSDVAHYAIHPGGVKILRAIEDELQIPRNKNEFAYEVLRNYGNMSSPTVLFVLDRIMKNLGSVNQDEYVLSFAFGPGLTMESMLLRVEHI